MPAAVSRYQAIIVGGGVHGASIFHHLTAAGMDRVLLLERKTLACAAMGGHRDPEQTSITQKG